MSGHACVMSSLQWILLTSGLLRLACAGNAQVTLDASAQAHVQLETTRLIRSHRRPTESEQRKHGSSPGVGVIQAEILGNESLLLDQRLQSVARMLRVGSPTKDFLMKLSLCVPCGQFEKFGDQNQGYVMCTEDLDRSTIAAAYSYGVDGNDSWGTDMASRYGFAVHEYAKDCGEPRRPLVCSGCHMNFHTAPRAELAVPDMADGRENPEGFEDETLPEEEEAPLNSTGDDEDEGEDLLGDNMMDDYRDQPEEDHYDPEMLDDGPHEPLTMATRLAAER
eukprot:s9971_g1.t2